MRGATSKEWQIMMDVYSDICDWVYTNNIERLPVMKTIWNWHWCPFDGSCGCPEIVDEINTYAQEKGYEGPLMVWSSNRINHKEDNV